VARKKAFGTLNAGVKVGQPIRDWRPGSQYKRHVGARPKHYRLTLASDSQHGAVNPSLIQ
jgi:hypothetical protein